MLQYLTSNIKTFHTGNFGSFVLRCSRKKPNQPPALSNQIN